MTLEGGTVRLVPLELRHVPALHHAARDPEVPRYLSRSPGRTLAEAETYVRTLLEEQAAGEVLSFVVTRREGGDVLGATRFLDIDRANDSVEIGTWLDSAYWRSAVNTELKLLLLRHAFEREQVHRVGLHTDLRNERSQAAIVRLGAVREGILRGDRRMPDGTYRSTISYSILADEWPRVRAKLERALSRAGLSPGGRG